MSTVLPPPARGRQGRSTARRTGRGRRPRRGARADGTAPAGRLSEGGRVPLRVLGQTLAKAWHDRILGLSAEAAFWQILSVPPLLIGLLGSLGYLGSVIGGAPVREIEDRLLTASAEVLTPDVVDKLVAPTLADILGSGASTCSASASCCPCGRARRPRPRS